MNLNEAKNKIFATGTIPDGYFGERKKVYFSFDKESGKTLAIHNCGMFTYHTPPANDVSEALFLLNFHPSAKEAKITNSIKYSQRNDF